MKILVTGGTGSVGRSVVSRLIRNGHIVRVVGRREGLEIEGGEYARCDVTEYTALREQARGMEAIVHLAAIPGPSRAPGQTIFQANCQGTYHVYRAAAEEGIGRVVTASSINALGYNFGIKEFDLLYFPIDEKHPTMTTDPYSFSKQIVEEIADYFWRREGISGVCLRLPWVIEMTQKREQWLKGWMPKLRHAHEELFDMSPDKAREQVQRIRDAAQARRDNRFYEYGGARPQGWTNMESAMASAMTNLWTVIDARDSAQAVELGLSVKYEGSHVLFVNDVHNSLGVESERLVRTFFPDVSDRKCSLEDDDVLVSPRKAQELLGFQPEFSLGGRLW